MRGKLYRYQEKPISVDSKPIEENIQARKFPDEDFLLHSEVARVLYFDYASAMPIIDYHCHLSPKEIAENRRFNTITQAWLEGDHYKWRAMRTFGIDEKYITGAASDREKFRMWASVVPFTVRNPLFHWTHLELQRYFGINTPLNANTADEIYDACNEQLNSPDHSVHGLLQQMSVEVICSTDDPSDDLAHHIAHAETGRSVKLVPGFRPDKAIYIERTNYREYISALEVASGVSINSFSDLLEALQQRIDFFIAQGCRLSDHGLEHMFAADFIEGDADSYLKLRLDGKELKDGEVLTFKSALLYELSKMYHRAGWVQQFHLGALRNNSERMMNALGPDTGFDSIGDFAQAESLAAFLNKLDRENSLSKTVLYNLNPRDNALMATMIGNFNDGSVRGKMQFGSAWWFLDQKDGIRNQLNALSNMSLLSCFIGMLTDSRSFLSFPRHEYFRRILCNLIGEDVVNGELPADMTHLGKIVQDICYNNTKEYFGF